MGFGLGAVTLAACQPAPVHKSIPYLIKPEEITPGVANYYVSSYKGQGILVKTREGRPIKFEPNDVAPVNGGTNARVQGAVLSLYDNNRLKQPLLNGAEASWGEVDKAVKAALEAANASGKKVVLLTGSVVSPATRALIAQFGSAYTNFEHVEADAYSYSNKLPIKWVRIHNLPDLAYFNHAQHVTAGQVECQTCHGPVQEMEEVYQYSELTMGWCINCHRETEVQVETNGYYATMHDALKEKYKGEKITVSKIGGLECGKCHY